MTIDEYYKPYYYYVHKMCTFFISSCELNIISTGTSIKSVSDKLDVLQVVAIRRNDRRHIFNGRYMSKKAYATSISIIFKGVSSLNFLPLPSNQFE